MLVGAFSDYLVGVHDAATEFTVDEAGAGGLLRAFVEMDDSADAQIISELTSQINLYGAEIAGIFSCPVPAVSAEIVDNNDWAENWKEHFKPFAIVDGLVIAPTWEPYTAAEEEQVIVMDPGMAFGTGHHATTRLCLEVMSALEISGKRVLDVGTGTGILAMAALLWGASEATAIDTDKEAVSAAKTNAERNSLSERMHVSDALLEQAGTGFDLVIANIIHDVLVGLSDELARAVSEDGRVLLSGLLDGEQGDNLVRIFARKGFEVTQHRADEQWCALLLQKKR